MHTFWVSGSNSNNQGAVCTAAESKQNKVVQTNKQTGKKMPQNQKLKASLRTVAKERNPLVHGR